MENPEWTAEDFARAKNPEDVLSPVVLAVFGKRRGPQKAPRKVPASIRLSEVVITHFKDQGPGWQSKIDQALKKMVMGNQKGSSGRHALKRKPVGAR